MVSLSDVWVAVQPDTRGFEPALRSRLQRMDFGLAGRKVGTKVGAAISKAAAEATGRGGLLKTATVSRQAATVGAKAGGSLGTALAEKASAKIGQPKIFSRFAAAATKAAKTAGAQMAIGAAREVSSRLGSATKAGTSFGRKFGQSASSAAGSAFKAGGSALKFGGKGLAGLGGLKAGIVGLGASLVGGAVFTGLKGLANAASNLNETLSKGRNIFGSSAKSIESWSKSSARSLGLSRQEALDGAAAFGNLFDQLGFGVGQSTKMSKGFVQMASDAASFNNANPAEVMDAFLSATRGEYDALQKYIPTASAATIQAEAMRMTHKKSVTDLTAADKAAALYSVAVRDLGKAHGDFARTSGGFANQQRIMAANWADLKVKIGQYFLPAFTKAAVYMNTEGFPALTRIVGALGNLGTSAGRMAKAVSSALMGTFGPAVDSVTWNLTELADWLETHQAAMVRFFLRLGDGAIALGRTITGFVIGSLRGFADFSDGLAEIVRSTGPALASILEQMASMPIFGKKMRDSFADAAVAIRNGSAAAADGLTNTAGKARDAATAIGDKAYPAFDKAGKALHRVGEAEIWKAKQRDAAAAASIAIRDVGTKGDFARLNLKNFNIEGDRGTEAQRRFAARVRAARDRLAEQLTAAKNAGVGQKDLTRTWEIGRDRLFKEFRQMGYSNKAAKDLAARYAGIKPKIETKVSQPGMKSAIESTKELDRRIHGINNKTVKLSMQFAASATKAAVQFFKTVPGSQASGFVNSFNAAGGVLPGFTPGRDVHHFSSPTAGQLHLSGGEAIMRPEWTRGVGGPAAVARMNANARAGRGPGFAGGGTLSRNLRLQYSHNGIPGAVGRFGPAGMRAGSELTSDGGQSLGKAAVKAINNWTQDSGSFSGEGGAGVGRLAQRALAQVGHAWAVGMCLNFVRRMAGAPGGTYDATAAWRNARHKHPGDRSVPSGVPVYWGGGHGHIAVSVGGGRIVTTDYPRTGRIGTTTLGHLTSTWGKPYRGWANDVNGVTTSRVGLASGAVVRGGRGGISAVVGEGRHDELVAPLPRNWRTNTRAGSPDVVELGPRSIAAIASALTVEIDGRQVARAVRYQTVRGST